MSKNSLRLDSLDLVRGLAAFAVVAGHLRAFLFMSHSSLLDSGVALGVSAKVFYFATSFGHTAVIIFFALSGFLVGGKALSNILDQNFSWPRYLLRRIIRLWLVVVPALALTLLFDAIGADITDGVGYDGSYYELYASSLPVGGVDHSLITLLGNLTFLQTILVPTFGSNGPMWSLANEFWYYIVFPLAAWLYWGKLHTGKAIGLIALLLLVVLLPGWLLAAGAIWAAGAAAAWCSRLAALSRYFRATSVRFVSLAFLISALLLSRVPAAGLGDIGLGIAVALTLPVLAHLPSPGGLFTKVARASSELSYTLYLTHFPFLTFIVMSAFAPQKWLPGFSAAGLYSALFLAAIAWAGMIWWCFERHTNLIYAALSAKLLPTAIGKGTLESSRPSIS